MCWLSPPSARSHPADCKTEPGVFLSPSTPEFLYNPPTPAPYTVLLLFVENAWGKEGGWCVSVPATNEVVSSRGWQGWLRRVFTRLASSSGWRRYPGALWVRRPLPFVRARAGGSVCRVQAEPTEEAASVMEQTWGHPGSGRAAPILQNEVWSARPTLLQPGLHIRPPFFSFGSELGTTFTPSGVYTAVPFLKSEH